jgi:ABC-type glycerol-3-phosphate transport system substrate-binding protein
MMQGYGYDGSLYRVPHEFACGYFFYRKDLLDEMGLEVPTTWDEIIEVGTQVTDKENNVWATLDAISKGGLLWVYLAYLTSQTGGSIFDVDEGTIEAIQFLYDMIHTHEIFPEDALNMNYDQQNEMYMDDRVMFMRQWPYCQAVFESDEEWFAPEKAVITLPPGGSAGPGSWWGGWGFTLPSMAPNPEGAQELIKFITSPEIAPKLAEGQSWFIMPRTSILEAFADKDDAIVNAMGMYADAGVIKPRPFHARAAEAQVAFEDGIALYLTDQESLEDAVEIAKTLIAELDEE